MVNCPVLPPENMSLLTSSRTATPMLSLVITLFSMTSEPSELAMATWLNSTVCFWTKVNLHKTSRMQHKYPWITQETLLCYKHWMNFSKPVKTTTISNWHLLGYEAQLWNSLLRLEEHSTAVHVFPLLFRNQFGTRLWAEIAVIATLL